jgi:Ring finger domain
MSVNIDIPDVFIKQGPLPSHLHRSNVHHLPAHARYSSIDGTTRPTPLMSNRPRVRSMLDADPGFRRFMDQVSSSPSSRPHPSPRPRLQESDICPICRHGLPPKGADGDETAREAHIIDCIAARDPSAPASPSSRRRSMAQSPPSAPIRMLPFTASEKDCVGEDGTTQECSICFVEYDVGDQLARLECLCKFHRTCIVEWFSRKQECPVHRVA